MDQTSQEITVHDYESAKSILQTDRSFTKAYIFRFKDDDDDIISYALLSDITGPREKESSYRIDLVYTYPTFRRQGYAESLLTYIKERENVVVFCTDRISRALFEQAEYNFIGTDPLGIFNVYKSELH